VDIPQFVGGMLERTESVMLQALDGLSADELDRQPGPDSNPIGWLTWHLTRVQDRHVSAMQGKEQAWVTDGWHAKFERPADLEDRGFGHTPEQVAAFRSPDAETLVAHYRAIRENTQRFLDALTPADLERQVPAMRGDGTMLLSARLLAIMVDNMQHMGQVAYLRGLIRGAGWYGA
jgi:uncharacterized damage-inducible protein DinB